MTHIKRTLLRALSPAGRRARLMIFSYHRVLAQADPLLPGLPDAQRFERQLCWIKRYCTPLRLVDAIDRLVRGNLPERAIAITFDDGYEDNLTIAGPILKKHGLPATLFVAVAPVVSGIMWNDVLVEAVRLADDTLDARNAELGTLSVGASKGQVLQQLINAAKYRPVSERAALTEAIYADISSKPLPRLMLRPAQLSELAQFGFDVGAHTVNHPILKMLDDASVRAEIADSRAWLASRTGSAPTLFAYPNGKRDDDYDVRHAEIVRSLGFRAAVTTNWGCAKGDSPLFELPRFKPWEDTEYGFYSRLCKVALQSYIPAPKRTPSAIPRALPDPK